MLSKTTLARALGVYRSKKYLKDREPGEAAKMVTEDVNPFLQGVAKQLEFIWKRIFDKKIDNDTTCILSYLMWRYYRFTTLEIRNKALEGVRLGKKLCEEMTDMEAEKLFTDLYDTNREAAVLFMAYGKYYFAGLLGVAVPNMEGKLNEKEIEYVCSV